MSNHNPPVQNVPAWPIGAGVVLFLCAIAFQIACLVQPLPFLVGIIFTRDDAFYYFAIARNIADSGVPTFDGMHHSNGVQFLWNFILVPLGYLFEDKVQFLRAVLALCVLVNVAVGLLIRTVGRRIHSAVLGDMALMFWAGVLIERWNTLEGMEYSLHLAVILLIILAWWRVVFITGFREKMPVWALGILLMLNFWVRLDSAIFSVAIWAAAIFVLWRQNLDARRTGQMAVALTLPAALGAVAFVATSYIMAGTFLPISGAAKSHYAREFFRDVSGTRALIEQVGWWLKIQALEPLSLIPSNIFDLSQGGGFNPLTNTVHFLSIAIPGVISLLGIWWVYRKYDMNSATGRLVKLAFLVWGVSAVHAVVNIAVIGDFSHVTKHYYGWLLLFWLFWGSLLLIMVLNLLPARLQKPTGLAIFAILAVCYALVGAQNFQSDAIKSANRATIRMNIAADLNKSLPGDAIVGAWNAGALSYFLERPVVNLDGLVNDKEYLEVLNSGVPLGPYLTKAGVTHIIDHNERDLTLRFNEQRDRENFFRNGIAWDEVEIEATYGALYVLRYIGKE